MAVFLCCVSPQLICYAAELQDHGPYLAKRSNDVLHLFCFLRFSWINTDVATLSVL